MTKEEILKAAVARFNGVDVSNIHFGNTKSEEAVLSAMDEYTKQQAIAFDIWKRENGYLIDPSGEHYLKIVIDGDFAHNEIVLVDKTYDQFIESQNK
jgi:hypothetical protein